MNFIARLISLQCSWSGQIKKAKTSETFFPGNFLTSCVKLNNETNFTVKPGSFLQGKKKKHLWHRIEIFYFRESQRFKVFFAGGKKTFLFFPHGQHFLSFSCLMWWESIFRGISLSLRKQWKSFSTVWNTQGALLSP